MMRKILVPTDGSPYSIKSADYAAKLARELGSKVSILHVSTYFPHVRARELVESEEKTGADILSKTKEVFDRADVHVEVMKLEFGHPADVICSVAEKGGFDLIVMGEKGAGEVKRFLLGSVADRVAHHATCPVLIVR
jgi:nucleotide-binding universal stress UspA family protein